MRASFQLARFRDRMDRQHSLQSREHKYNSVDVLCSEVFQLVTLLDRRGRGTMMIGRHGDG